MDKPNFGEVIITFEYDPNCFHPRFIRLASRTVRVGINTGQLTSQHVGGNLTCDSDRNKAVGVSWGPKGEGRGNEI